MSLERRLEKLEEQVPPVASSGVRPVVRLALDKLAAAKQSGSVGEFTQREINLLGGLYARQEVDGASGELVLPSGTLLAWSVNGDGTRRISASGSVAVEDLPMGVRQYVRREDREEAAEVEAMNDALRHKLTEPQGDR